MAAIPSENVVYLEYAQICFCLSKMLTPLEMNGSESITVTNCVQYITSRGQDNTDLHTAQQQAEGEPLRENEMSFIE